MGVRGLYTYCKKYGKVLTHAELCKMAPQKIGIDISHYIFKWQGDTNKLVHFIRELEESYHKPLCVFDGKHEQAKLPEADRRNNKRAWESSEAQRIQQLLEKNRNELTDEQIETFTRMIATHQRKGWQLTQEIRHGIKRALYENYIPLVKSSREADLLLASLAYYEQFEWIISGDLDLLALGVNHLLVPLQDSNDYLYIYRPAVLQGLQMSDIQFRQMCAMCCTDSVKSAIPHNVHDIIPWIRKYRDIHTLHSKMPQLMAEWPSKNHIFFENIPSLETCILETDYENYIAYKLNKPMPYLSPEEAPEDPLLIPIVPIVTM